MASPVEPLQSHVAPPEYYDVLVVGRTGMGKSTTANKLLGIEEVGNKRFVTGDGSESVTAQCKLQENVRVLDTPTAQSQLPSKEQNVRVLDTPGFASTLLTKDHGGSLECNLQIFEWILQEQEKRSLAFRRVLYFLPNRGPLERAEGELQEEIRVMYDFLGQDIFNIMVIIATNPKDERYQIEFDEEDIGTTEKAFTAAFEKVIGQQLKCPPIFYLPFAGTDLLEKITSIEVIAEKPLDIQGKEPVFIEITPKENGDAVVHDAQQKHPGQRLKFQVSCRRCTSRLTYENFPSGMWITKAVDENGDKIPLNKTKCHPILVPKHSVITKILGGMAHIATLGIFALVGWCRGKAIWPGFTNSDKICPVCDLPSGSEGCSVVGEVTSVPTNGRENVDLVPSHSTSLDEAAGQRIGSRLAS